LARLAVGLTMVFYGLAKVADPTEFLKEIHNYGILPAHPPYFMNLTAALMPWAEVVLGAALVLGVLVRGASGLIVLLMVAFTAVLFHRAIGIQAAKGIAFCAVEFDCGCGTGVVNICEKLPFNLGLVVLGLVAFLSNSRRFCLSQWLHGRRARPSS
jgi:uncharacterized membrane protein YphA (DoxX/SURF4 family)